MTTPNKIQHLDGGQEKDVLLADTDFNEFAEEQKEIKGGTVVKSNDQASPMQTPNKIPDAELEAAGLLTPRVPNEEPQKIIQKTADKPEIVIDASMQELLTLEGAMLPDMMEAHEKNSLENNQFRSTKEFMQGVRYTIPLNELYEVQASCTYDEDANYCPVLVKIIDATILVNNSNKPYLLQVWTKHGDMVFERSLMKPPCNWNVSNDKFLFQEESDSPEIFVVRMFLDKPPNFFKFTFPLKATTDRINTQYDVENERFVIPPEVQRGDAPDLDELRRSKTTDYRHMMALGELRTDLHKSAKERATEKVDDFDASTFHSVSEYHTEDIIKRSPDKMIDFLQGYILLAYRDTLMYCDSKGLGIEDDDITNLPQDADKNQNYVEIKVKEDQVSYLTLHKNYKIISIQEIGNELSALVIEDIVTRQVRFLRIFYQGDEGQSNKRQFKLVQLGVFVNSSEQTASPLLKYRAVSKIDKSSGKSYQVSIVVRENGRFEVYADFMLVSEYMNPRKQCVDIETDFNQFYFKFVRDSHLIDKGADPATFKFEIRQARHFWRNRINYSTTKLKKQGKKCWDIITHKRISRHFKLYTQIINFSMFMLVSHRNMISVYDMSHKAEWTHTEKFERGMIRQMFIKKISKQEREKIVNKFKKNYAENDLNSINNRMDMLSVYMQYQIVCIIGTHDICFSRLNANGLIKHQKDAPAIGRIIRFQNDDQYNQGMLLLTDESVASMEYKEIGGSKLHMFPYSESNDPNMKVTLSCLKQGETYPLLDSKTPNFGECVSFDSYFKVMRANKVVFEKSKGELNAAEDEGEDEIAALEKEYVNVVICTSDKRDKSTMFAIMKHREEETGQIKGMSLLMTDDQTKTLEQNQLEDDETPIHSFFVNSSEYGENCDSYLQVTEKFVTIYDKDMQISKTFEGLNIKSCEDVHQSYMYTISDHIHQPYEIVDEKEDVPTPRKVENFSYSQPGLYVYDLAKFFQGKVEKYKLSKAIGGQSNFMDNSKFSDRFSFLQDFNRISVIPFPHLNLINCVGMSQKRDYLIWREKNGFFTALDKNSNLNTWSLVTGKMLYSETQESAASKAMMKNYEVFRADENDITYTHNFYHLSDHSINLLKSKKPLDKKLLLQQAGLLGKSIDTTSQKLQKKIEKQNLNNKQGKVLLDKGARLLEEDLFIAEPQMTVQVLNSQQQAELFHFKVMQLKVFEDSPENNRKYSECMLRFHFNFSLLKTKQRDYLKQFDWDVNSEPQQRLYLSKDTKSMMEVINDFVATVYYRTNVSAFENLDDEDDFGQEIKWNVDYRIKRFNKMLLSHTSVPYLFSPNFTYQLDFNYRARQFEIKESRTQYIHMKIPKDLLDIEWDRKVGEDAIKLICSRISWQSETLISIINESNIECLFELRSTDPYDQDMKARYLHLLSSTKIDNLNSNMKQLDSHHLTMDPKPYQPRDVLERLMRTNQLYKRSIHHLKTFKQLDHSILSTINYVDYLQKWSNPIAKFDVQLSFTWLDWKILESVIKDDKFNIDDVETEQLVQLCFNIFPRGRGPLHYLALGNNTDKFGSVQGDQIQSFYATQRLFEVASELHDLKIDGTDHLEDGVSFEIPILPDMYGTTPLDICLGINTHRKADSRVFYVDEEVEKEIRESENTAMAELIFSNIKNYGFMHSSQLINEAIIKAIELGLTNIGDYFESRMQSVQHCFNSSTQHALKRSNVKKTAAMGEYGMVRAKIWDSENKMKEALFDETKSLQPMVMQYMDVPQLHYNTLEGMDFIDALSKSNDLELFALKSVQVLIDAQHSYWFKIDFYAFFLVELFQLIIFWFWSNIVLPNEKEGDKNTSNTVLSIILVCTLIYFVIMEAPQIYKAPIKYVTNEIKIVNFLVLLGIFSNVIRDDYTQTGFWTVQTYTALAIWLRFLIKMRIFAAYSFLIRMVVACIVRMIPFLVIFLVGVFAFADAYKSIYFILTLNGKIEPAELLEDPDTYDLYFKSYVTFWQTSFLYALGAFDVDNMALFREIDWLVFFICCLFNLIVMLNLLIAIISDEFEIINSKAVEHSYREKAIQMSIMQDTLFGFKVSKANPTEMLFTAKVITQEEIEDEKTVDQIGDLDKKLETQISAVREEMTQFMEEKLLEFVQNINDKIEGKGKDNKLARTKTIYKTPAELALVKKQDRQRRRQGAKTTQAAEMMQSENLVKRAVNLAMKGKKKQPKTKTNARN